MCSTEWVLRTQSPFFLAITFPPTIQKQVDASFISSPIKRVGWCSFICDWGNTSKYGQASSKWNDLATSDQGTFIWEITIHILPNFGGAFPYFYPLFEVTNRQLGWLEFAPRAPNSSSPSIELDFELRHLWLQSYQSGIGLVSYLGDSSDMKGVIRGLSIWLSFSLLPNIVDVTSYCPEW